MNLTAPSSDITFGRSNAPNGWLSMHSPYGYRYNSANWQSIAQAWYSIVHGICGNKYTQGHYPTSRTEMSESEKHGHLIGILNAVVMTHPILQTYLLDTGYARIVYSVSKYASADNKWLGYNHELKIGYNWLGRSWMTVRQSLREAINNN